MTAKSSRPARTRRSPVSARGQDLKQERAMRTRVNVLAAAAEAFAANGFPAVTILDIAELAGVTKGAVYFHFVDKEELALAVAEEFYERLSAMAEEVRQLNMTPLDKVTELVTRTAAAFVSDKVIQAGARLQIEHALIDTDLPTPYVAFGQVVTELLTEARQEGQLAPDSAPDVLSQVLVSAFFGTQHISWVLTNRQDLGDRTDAILDVVLPRPD